MKAWTVLAYTYEADHHCEDCAVARFGDAVLGLDDRWESLEDSEGNTPHPVFASDEWWDVTSDECETLHCGDCLAECDYAHSPQCEELGGPEPCTVG